jgi:hypothetical protein
MFVFMFMKNYLSSVWMRVACTLHLASLSLSSSAGFEV